MGRVLKAEPAEKVARGAAHAAEISAARILAEARAQAEAVVEEARQEGLARAAVALARARSEAARLAAEAEPELRRLAVAIAARILGRELLLAPDAVVDIVRQALTEAAARQQVVLRVHPDDAGVLGAARASLASAAVGEAGLAVVVDETVGRGGCVIETEGGVIDARLAMQLAAIERALCEGK